MKDKIDLTGKIFDRLTVLKMSSKKYYWVCLCSCGNTEEVIVSTSGLKSGKTKSCGCLHKERARESNITHGLRHHILYNYWKNMKNRCYNHKHKSYSEYSGRGITVCDRWLNSVESFISDMYPTYSVGLELDRIDNDKGYSPENCRWVSRQQNLMNRRGHINSSSKYKGVSKLKGKDRWRARITKDFKYVHLGYFYTEEQAAKAYNKAAQELFGEFANLNKIEDLK